MLCFGFGFFQMLKWTIKSKPNHETLTQSLVFVRLTQASVGGLFNKAISSYPPGVKEGQKKRNKVDLVPVQTSPTAWCRLIQKASRAWQLSGEWLQPPNEHNNAQLQEKDQKPRPKPRVQEVWCKDEWWNYMKLVSNVMGNRETKFSFWVRGSQLVPATGHSSVMLTITEQCLFKCTGWRPQGSQARTQLKPHSVHLLLPHHCYYIQQRKEILSISSRTAVVTEKLKINTTLMT